MEGEPNTTSDVGGGFVYLEHVAIVQEQGDKSGSLNVRVGTVNKKGQVKPGSKWVYAYFLVSGGSLHFYIRKEVREAVSFFRCVRACVCECAYAYTDMARS